MKPTSLTAALPGIVAVLLGGPAMAACPVAADLDGPGIVLERDDGVIETFTRESEYVIRDQVEFGDGYGNVNRLAHGAHLLDLIPTKYGKPLAGQAFVFDYPLPVADMPVPAPQMNWEVRYSILLDDYSFPETQTQVWGAPKMLVIGGCRYEVIPAMVQFDSGGESHGESLLYFTALGIAFYNGWFEDGMPPEQHDLAAIRVNQ